VDRLRSALEGHPYLEEGQPVPHAL
jgi:hypothetical protein